MLNETIGTGQKSGSSRKCLLLCIISLLQFFARGQTALAASRPCLKKAEEMFPESPDGSHIHSRKGFLAACEVDSEDSSAEGSAGKEQKPSGKRRIVSTGRRDSWYIGFGFRPLNDMKLDGKAAINAASSKGVVGMDFAAGGTISRKFLFGGHFNFTEQSVTSDGYRLTVSDTLLGFQGVYFFKGEGAYLRGTIGSTVLTVSVRNEDDSKKEILSDSKSGSGWIIGAGHAFWLGKSFNLNVDLNYSQSLYGKSDMLGFGNVGKVTIYGVGLGFYWY